MNALVKIIGLLVVAIAINGCVSPERREVAAARDATECALVGNQINSVRSCLFDHGFDGGGDSIRGEYAFQKCGPYWGWPFMASCGGIIVTTKEDAVVSWQALGMLDGV